MEKSRISTTISPKHYAILKKHAGKYGTQQGALERAIECLDQSPQKIAPPSREEELWLRLGRDLNTAFSVVQADAFVVALETVDFGRIGEYLARSKPLESIIEYCYQKPLGQCSLPELLDGLALSTKTLRLCDAINYTDEGDYYDLYVTHYFGLNGSKMVSMLYESAFASYGVETETQVSERSIFTRIYKGGVARDPGRKKRGTEKYAPSRERLGPG